MEVTARLHPFGDARSPKLIDAGRSPQEAGGSDSLPSRATPDGMRGGGFFILFFFFPGDLFHVPLALESSPSRAGRTTSA